MDTAQQIKEKLDIADFIRSYVSLTPAGKNLKGNCPFHKEKTPSFIVSPDRQIWHCFGCSLGGDIFGFLMRYENIEFFDALKILAEKAGIEIARSLGPDQKAIQILYQANQLAKEFFQSQITQPVRDYLAARGLKPETIAEFEIGFATDQIEALTRFLLGKGLTIQAIEKAGLSLKTERGTYRDRFRNRIMFPLYNQFGKVVAFTGRIMPGFESENLGKYVNSPETAIFQKSKLLYGLHKSKNFIRETKTAVLMEGQMDLIMSWQDGVKNLVATSGTALTTEHLKSLRRSADSLVLSFDQDGAGKMAAERTIDMANAADFVVKVIKVAPELAVKDPADIAQAQPGMIAKLVAEAAPAMEYLMERYQLSNIKYQDRGSELLKKNVRAVLAKVKNISSAVERDYWLKEISNRVGIDVPVLQEEAAAIPEIRVPVAAESAEEAPKPPMPNLSRKDLIGQRIITLVMNYREFSDLAKGQSEEMPEVYRQVLGYHLDPKSVILGAEVQPIADMINLRSGIELTSDAIKAKEELAELFRQLKIENLRGKKQELLWAIKMAEQKNDEPGLSAALSGFDKVMKDMQNLEKPATLV
ncbi:MAG: DNA primase [Parcubacteria group bacterium Gr01-1014_19]|nr:MAG: DNA primase [Parcubacteria group bacterium Gr01-1014_19]